ncbi:MAG: hypothetical protein II639_03680 [Clostridia bacterium]|nr:hypothetical protein [Clostridia bacterium]
MNENAITPEVEEVESQIEGAEAEAETDEDGWPTEWTGAVEEDDGDEGETDEVTTEADQPTEEPKPEETKDAEKPAETEPEQKTEEEDQFLELKHMDTVRKVNRDEAKVLAQKGLDYDRIRGERDAMQKDYAQLKKYESFLNELKGDFPSIDAMMTDTRARMLAEKEGISYADAVAKVGVMQQGAQPQQTQVQQGQPKVPAVDQFVQKYPGVKAEEIPQAVWDEVKRTGDLVGAYENYQNTKVKDEKIKNLELEIETLKQNQKNAARSTGSATSSGKTSGKSLIQQLWDEDDY